MINVIRILIILLIRVNLRREKEQFKHRNLCVYLRLDYGLSKLNKNRVL